MSLPERKVRPAVRSETHDAVRSGRHTPKKIMEAFETPGTSPQGSDGPALHRIDSDRVAETLGSARYAAGFSRLELMLTAVLPRLVDDGATTKPD
jgi:hypothetical protein